MSAIRVADIAEAKLPAGLKLQLIETLIKELAMAQALVLIHGQGAGLIHYRAMGGHVWYDADGEPVISYRSP